MSQPSARVWKIACGCHLQHFYSWEAEIEATAAVAASKIPDAVREPTSQQMVIAFFLKHRLYYV